MENYIFIQGANGHAYAGPVSDPAKLPTTGWPNHAHVSARGSRADMLRRALFGAPDNEPQPGTTTPGPCPAHAPAGQPEPLAATPRLFRLLGLDPGFASVGWSQVDMLPDGTFRLVRCGVIQTVKVVGKGRSASMDNAFRAAEITKALVPLFEDMDLICVESMSFPRSSSVAAKMAMCWGVICTLTELHQVVMIQQSPQAIKEALTGRRTASKKQVQRGVAKILGVKAIAKALAKIPPSKHEHPMDATAAALAMGDKLSK